jgi:hypothetical protein
VKIVTRGLLALVAAISIGALPTAAHAERVVHNDARGDLIYQTYNPETSESGEEPAPSATVGDVVRTAVRHRTSNVFVAVTFADLRRADDLSGHVLRLVTNEGLKRNVFLEVTKENPRGSLSMSKSAGPRVTCKGLSRDIDYSTEVLKFAIPRSCLGSPSWVRVGFMSYRYPDSSSYNGYIDDANKNQSYGGSAGPALGDRVSRN